MRSSGWVGVFGEPDERDGVVVDRAREPQGSPRAPRPGRGWRRTGRRCTRVRASRSPRRGRGSAARAHPGRNARPTVRAHSAAPNSVDREHQSLAADDDDAPFRAAAFSRFLGSGLMMSRLIAAVSFPSLVARCPSSCASTAGSCSFSKQAAGEHQRVPAHRGVGLWLVESRTTGSGAAAARRRMAWSSCTRVLVGGSLAL